MPRREGTQENLASPPPRTRPNPFTGVTSLESVREHLHAGVLTEVTSQWNGLVVDPNDLNYTAAIGELFGIDNLVSGGEDNAGNLYIVDFGYGAGFQGQYPGRGWEITLVPEPGVTAALPVAAWLLLRRSRRTFAT